MREGETKQGGLQSTGYLCLSKEQRQWLTLVHFFFFVNLLLLLLFLHSLEPHIILINNYYKIMQKVQEMSGKQTVCIFQKDS